MPVQPDQRAFQTTPWSVVYAAGDSGSPERDAAMEAICQGYWYPLYTFVRLQGHGPEAAEDLTQEFFFQLLRNRMFASADEDRGRFRSFLIRSLRNFLTDRWRYEKRSKRGGGRDLLSIDALEAESHFQLESVDGEHPERLFDRKWANALVNRVLAALKREYRASGQEARFEVLKLALLDGGTAPYASLAGRLDMSTTAFKTAVHRFRNRYRELFRREVAGLVDDPNRIDDEIAHILSMLV